MTEKNPFYDLFKDLLEDHKRQIIEAITQNSKDKNSNFPKYVKGSELRKLLGGISEGKLQLMRSQGLIFSKIQGLILYPLQEVMDYLEAHKSTRQ
jgi:hypothetical protein